MSMTHMQHAIFLLLHFVTMLHSCSDTTECGQLKEFFSLML